jgi:hypothetical protein
MSLSDMFKNPSTKASIVEECTRLMDEQVANKRGVSGMALKTAYRVVRGVGPNYVSSALGRILPDACVALEPMWSKGVESGDPVNYLSQHCSRTADIILSVTDARVHKASGAVAGAYSKLRKSVKGDIEAAVPGLAGILGDHAQATHSI